MFGQPQASTGFSFGQGSTPAFGASSTPAFGASSTPAFGASSTPAFGASTGGSFSFASSTPAFGAASSTPAFGASSTPAFNFSSTPALGAGTTTAFGQTPQPSLFGQQPAQQAQQQVPFTRASTFESLPKDVQNQLQQIQEQISRYEADRLKVQQLPHLQDAPAHQQGLDAEISCVRGELKELSGLIKAQEEGLSDFKEKSQQLLKAADMVVKTYGRNKAWREGQARGEAAQETHKYMSLPVTLPGPYLEEAVRGMAQSVGEYCRVLDEVEQVLASSRLQDPSQVDWRTVLPTIVSNMHDYFISVAAKLEKAHAEVESLKPAYRARLRAQGVYSDPFERARRQEQLQQQQQQQPRPSPASAVQQQAGLTAAGAAGAAAPLAMPAPAQGAGGLFGAAGTGTPGAPQAAPGAAGFGSPFPGAGTPFGASPFGGAQSNSGLSRSASKPKSKKR